MLTINYFNILFHNSNHEIPHSHYLRHKNIEFIIFKPENFHFFYIKKVQLWENDIFVPHDEFKSYKKVYEHNIY